MRGKSRFHHFYDDPITPYEVIITNGGGYNVYEGRRATRHYFKIGQRYWVVARKGEEHKFYVEEPNGEKYQIIDEDSFKRVLEFDDNHCALSVLEGDSPW